MEPPRLPGQVLLLFVVLAVALAASVDLATRYALGGDLTTVAFAKSPVELAAAVAGGSRGCTAWRYPRP